MIINFYYYLSKTIKKKSNEWIPQDDKLHNEIPSPNLISYRKHYEKMNPENHQNCQRYLEQKKKKFEVLGKFCKNYPMYEHHFEKLYSALNYKNIEGKKIIKNNKEK